MTEFLKKVLVGLCVISGTVPAATAQGGGVYDGKEIIDTLRLNHSTIVLFADKTWMFGTDPSFSGVLNDHVHSLVNNDSTMAFKANWYTDVPFTYDNDIRKLQDTLWLCTIDSTANTFHMPVKGPVISGFKYRGARFHHGVDIPLNVGDTVVSAFSGKVRYAQYNKGGFGNLVIVRHYNGLETYYAHLSKISVEPGQEVRAGELVGLGGKTGRAFGPHLHFEVRFYDHAFDPAEIINFEHQCLQSENLFIHAGMFDYRSVSRKNTQGASAQASASTAKGGAKYYTVRSGDNLSVIARRQGTSIDRLCSLNGISRNHVLQIGQKLRVN